MPYRPNGHGKDRSLTSDRQLDTTVPLAAAQCAQAVRPQIRRRKQGSVPVTPGDLDGRPANAPDGKRGVWIQRMERSHSGQSYLSLDPSATSVELALTHFPLCLYVKLVDQKGRRVCRAPTQNHCHRS
ncbi:hypothetical protein HRbin30_02879 [bacterium HR30]|nr:hypothetical protein HRbin30_02879 [bacterium HR30]